LAKKKIVYAFGADLSELERGWKKIDKDMRKMARQFETTGKTLTKVFTLPLAAIGGVATKAALDIDNAFKSIARGTGAQGEALKGLQADWKAVAGSVSQGFGESAKVLADYNTRLNLTGKALQKISKQALDAGRMLGENVDSIVSESSKAMQDWGVAADDMGKALDRMFAASQQTGIGMGQMSTQLYKYGAAMRGMGFDFQTATALMAGFEKQGVNTELILGSLRQGLGRMAKEGIADASEAFRELISRVQNAATATEATRLAIEIFGSRAGPDMALAIREGRFAIDDLIASLQNADGAIQKNSEETKTLGDRWLETKNQVMLAVEPIGKEILTIAESVMPKVQEATAKAGAAIAAMSDETKTRLLALAAVLAVGGPLLLAIGATLKMIAQLSAALRALALGAGSPVGIAILGFTALAAALNNFYNMSEKARESVRKTYSVLGDKGIIAGIRAQTAAINEQANALGRLGGDYDETSWRNPQPGYASVTGDAPVIDIPDIPSVTLPVIPQETQQRIDDINVSLEGTANTMEDISGAVDVAGDSFRDLQTSTEDFSASATNWGASIAESLADAIAYGKDLGEVLENLLRQLASQVLQKFLFGMFGFADGGAFSGGKLLPFARGGVVSRPTIFPMANGIGLMGEAGPEAVMPLKRGRDGRLGVEAEGGGDTVNVTMNINALDSRSVIEMLEKNRGVVESMVVSSFRRNGMMRTAIKQGI